jgi:DNA-binding IclR family transcriptional regulator
MKTQQLEKTDASLREGLKLGRKEHGRVILEIVSSLGEPSPEAIAEAADLDVQTVRASLRSLVRSGKVERLASGVYRVPAHV